jgi:hypothetical protein
MAAVQRGQKHSEEHPCRICGGWDRMPRGKGIRCHGYLGTDGKYEHCTREELAGGLPLEDLGTYAHRLEGPCKCGETHGDAPPRPSNGNGHRPTNGHRPSGANGHRDVKPDNMSHGSALRNERETGVWDYESGLRVVRKDGLDDDGQPAKRYVQRHRHPDGSWGFGLTRRDGCPADCRGAARALYRAPELRAADPDQFVFLVEGEKCVEILRSAGLVATTTPGGAKSWKKTADLAVKELTGRHVVILPDHDKDGEGLGEQAAEDLQRFTRSLRVLELPGLADGEDIEQWLQRGHDTEDLVRMADLRPNLSARFQPQTVAQILSSSAFSAPQLTFATGYLKLDELLDGGVKARQVTAIAAPTGAGKTAFGLELSRSLCEVRPILYCTTEIESEELAARVAGPALGARASDILALRCDPRRAAAAVEGWPIFPFEIEDLGDDMVITKFTGQTPIVVIDYLQDLVGEDGDRRRGAVARIARRLRQLARRRDTALIAISSVARSLYSATGRKLMADEDDPRAWLATAKESGDIEYSAAVFIYLDTSTEVDASGQSAARLIVAKSRRGRVGFVGLRFHGPTGRFLQDDGAVDQMGPQRKELDREKAILDAVKAAKQPIGKNDLHTVIKANKAATGHTLDRMVRELKVALIELKRPDKTGRMRSVDAVVLPNTYPALNLDQEGKEDAS